MRRYQILYELALLETHVIYESFFKFARHHYNIIRRSGRFPKRNVLELGSPRKKFNILDEMKQF